MKVAAAGGHGKGKCDQLHQHGPGRVDQLQLTGCGACNAACDSDYSNSASAVMAAAPAVPAAPGNLTATVVSKSQNNLSWTNSATHEDGFRIERCKGSTCTNFARIAAVGRNVTTYTNTKLTANTSYRYRVHAYNASGTSGYSNIALATTPKR